MKMMERKAYTAFGEMGFGETGRYRSTCTDPKFNRSRSHGYENRHSHTAASDACCHGCAPAAGVGLRVNATTCYLVK